MNYFALLTDLPDSPQSQNNPDMMNEKERELMVKLGNFAQEKREAEGSGIGIIDPQTMPNAYFNFLCYFIAYKTGTSLKDIMNFNLFDFVSYMYIIRETNPEEGDNPNNPQEKELMRTIGG